MNHEFQNRDLDQFVELVRTSLRAGHIPLDPETQEEFRTLKQEFPEESWRWDPTVEVRNQLLGEMLPPFGEEWQERFLSTVFANPSRYGRVLWHVISRWMHPRGK
tara:strand:+ start:388 stop:702 length:315 start_codon:yes stop_codon:yes gene_type:complete